MKLISLQIWSRQRTKVAADTAYLIQLQSIDELTRTRWFQRLARVVADYESGGGPKQKQSDYYFHVILKKNFCFWFSHHNVFFYFKFWFLSFL
jgi:hypothetical protein